MRPSVIILMVFLAAATPCFGQHTHGPQISFDVEEFDFGYVGEKDGKVSYLFTFENTGDRPLVITNIITSCKCVDYSYPKKPVNPLEKGVIEIKYNPRKQKGTFYKAIQIYTNASSPRTVIRIKGEVVAEAIK